MKSLSKVYTWFIFSFLYAPILVLVFFSFNASKSRSKWTGFSFKWYLELFHDSEIIASLRTTLIVAFSAAIVATVIGTAAAIGINAMGKKMRALVMNITYIPILNPEIVTGISLMLLFVMMGIGLGMTTLLLSHITFNIPYVILSVLPKLRQLDKNMFEAAQDLGAKPMQAFRKAILPEIMPGVASGFIMALTLSIDDFVISYFASGPSAQTLSVTIYSMTRMRVTPEINALSTLLFVVILSLLMITNAVGNKNKNKYKVMEESEK